MKKYRKYTKSTKIIPGISKLWLVQAAGARNLEKLKCPQKKEKEKERGISKPSLLRGRQKLTENSKIFQKIPKNLRK